jgi:UPF0271 protein
MKLLKLNCDLGEGYGAWDLGEDEHIMPLIDQANIACGFHAGDPTTILKTLQLAHASKIEVGAHPSYPDRVGFGRRSMRIAPDDLYNDVLYQTAALTGMAETQNIRVSYIKPHGALYHDMLSSSETFAALLQVAKNCALKLMVPAGATTELMLQQADTVGVELFFEAFADRRYTRHKTLLPRTEPGAVLTKAEMLEQARQLVTDSCVISDCGATIELDADTLCVHGDTPSALAALKEIRTLVSLHVN